VKARLATLVLALICGAMSVWADETLRLKNGTEITVKRLLRTAGKVRFETADGKVQEVPEADVVAPALDSIPLLVRLKDGRSLAASGLTRAGGQVRIETTDGQTLSVPEGQVAAPPLASIAAAPSAPLAAAPPAQEGEVLVLKNGDRIAVRRLIRGDGRVRFENLRGEVREVPEADVSAPPLDSIPILLRLADGSNLAVRRLLRRDGQVRFETMQGQVRAVPEAQVLSPALASIPVFGGAAPAPAPPVPAPAPVTPPVVVPAPVPVAPPPPPRPPAMAATGPDFEAMPDRWGILDLLPPHPRLVRGRPLDPYNQNVLKGDRPIIGNTVFLVLTGTVETPLEVKRGNIPSGVSAADPGSLEFFGRGQQVATSPRAFVSAELFNGQTAFRPKSWALKATGAFDVNYVRLRENNGVNADVREGRGRRRQDWALEEAFGELKLADLSEHFDVVSVRAGIQPFVSDFRGFIFSDSNLGARLFGNLGNNRWQYNAAGFDLLEKETNSELNTFARRQQRVYIANLFRQDFLKPGYTVSASFHRSEDHASDEQHYDANGFLVRPARIGTPRLHDVNANYAGLAGDGHLGRLNLSHAFYWVFGRDEDHPLAERSLDLGAQMGALELSVDRDWARFKLSGFFASGDGDPLDGRGRGFDSIYDLSNFAGGPFSFWTRSAIPLVQTSVLLKGPGSLLPDLRSNKFEGQANFVNPGLMLVHGGIDLDITPKLKVLINGSYLRFHKTEPLEVLLFQPNIHKAIGVDLGGGLLYRPWLNENVAITAGFTGLVPGAGWRDIFSSSCDVPGCGHDNRALFNGFVALRLVY
jgi:hypothetical protein